jgi:hypothetical protein
MEASNKPAAQANGVEVLTKKEGLERYYAEIEVLKRKEKVMNLECESELVRLHSKRLMVIVKMLSVNAEMSEELSAKFSDANENIEAMHKKRYANMKELQESDEEMFNLEYNLELLIFFNKGLMAIIKISSGSGEIPKELSAWFLKTKEELCSKHDEKRLALKKLWLTTNFRALFNDGMYDTDVRNMSKYETMAEESISHCAHDFKCRKEERDRNKAKETECAFVSIIRQGGWSFAYF